MKLLIFGLLVLLMVACAAPSASVKESPTPEKRSGFSGGANPNSNHRGKTPGQLAGPSGR
jgi:hypothetical protein